MKEEGRSSRLRMCLAFTFVALVSGTARPVAADCWVCESIAPGPATCQSLAGESGGTSCEIKCVTKFDTAVCICHTSGICEAGSGGCGGPCPQATAQPGSLESSIRTQLLAQAFAQEKRQERDAERRFAPNPALFERLGKWEPFAALVLEGLANDHGFPVGDFTGVISFVRKEGRQSDARVRFKAHVESVEGEISLAMTFENHEVQSLSGHFWTNGEWGHFDLCRATGATRHLDL